MKWMPAPAGVKRLAGGGEDLVTDGGVGAEPDTCEAWETCETCDAWDACDACELCEEWPQGLNAGWPACGSARRGSNSGRPAPLPASTASRPTCSPSSFAFACGVNAASATPRGTRKLRFFTANNLGTRPDRSQ